MKNEDIDAYVLGVLGKKMETFTIRFVPDPPPTCNVCGAPLDGIDTMTYPIGTVSATGKRLMTLACEACAKAILGKEEL